MPPKRSKRANSIFHEILVELRDNEEYASHMYWVYNKAAKNMKEYPEALKTLDEASMVNGIGPKIISDLKKKMGSTASSSNIERSDSSKPAKKAPGRPKKSASVADIPPDTMTGVATTSQNQLSVDQSSSGDGDQFLFCYLSYDQNQKEIRVQLREEARVELELAPGPGFYIEYPRSCQHSIVDHISSKFPHPNRMVGYLPMQIAELYFSHSTLPLDWLTRGVAPLTSSAAGSSSGFRRSTTEVVAAEKRTAFPSTQAAAGPSRSTGLKRSTTDVIADDLAAHNRFQGSTLDPARQQSTAGTWTIPTSGSASGSIKRSRTMPQMSRMPLPSSVSSRASQQRTVSSSQASVRRTDSTPATTGSSQSRKQATRPRPRLSHAIPLPSAEIELDIEDPYASTDYVELPEVHPLRIASHEYDVVLILDTREIKSGVDRSGIFDGLRRAGVNVEQRALNIGDVCWIAKRKPHYRDGSQYDEIALDCILERKRLDDLVGSIKDGRFHEQKFRLHNTAITKIYYIVEEYKLKGDPGVSEEQDKSVFDKAIETAISQTGIIDRFMVKETKSINDTISFYARLHKLVLLDYQHKDLHVIPSQSVKRYSYLKFQKELRRRHPGKSHLISWKAFDTLNSKSGFTTVRETWARMLLCVPGMSAEKAGILIQHFPTPISMRRACERAKQQQEEDDEDARIEEQRTGKPRKKKDIFIAEDFLEDYGGQTGRRIGSALSRKVYNIMMLLEYPKEKFRDSLAP